MLTVVLVTLAVLNAVCTAWATALDARPSAVLPAPSAPPAAGQRRVSAAQALAALPGALLGIPLGIGLFAVANGAGTVTIPPGLWLLAAVLGTLAAVAGLAAIRPASRPASPRPPSSGRNRPDRAPGPPGAARPPRSCRVSGRPTTIPSFDSVPVQPG